MSMVQNEIPSDQPVPNKLNAFGRISSRLVALASQSWVAYSLALLGGFVYVAQLWIYAHNRESVLDEGAYIYKGYLYVTGQYHLYQDYGPWSNHMPLAFLIPGSVQMLFGPGLAPARYFSVVLAILTLLGVWMLARRLGDKWWATAAVWVFALNPALIKMYSMAFSQGLVACMLTWSLVLVLGEDRPIWQIVLGSILAGLILLTRINMLPYIPLLLLYIFWEHGRRAGWLALLSSGVTVLAGHAFFWPGILQVWARTLPRELTPFLDDWRILAEYSGSWNPEVPTAGRFISLLHSIRFHFSAVIGALATLLLWPAKDGWRKQSHFRAAVFLCVLFWTLLLLHMWATLGNDYCVYCLDGYLGFFSMVGMLLTVVAFAAWRKELPWWVQLAIAVVIVAVCAGLGYAAFEDIGNQLLYIQIPRLLVDPGGTIAGWVTLSSVVVNKFQVEYADLRRVFPAIAGALVGILILVIAFVARRISLRSHPQVKSGASPAFGYWVLAIFLLVGTLFSPSIVLAGGQNTNDCSGDVLASYEAAGRYLAKRIPPGSQVYWKGGLSIVPLLYVPGISIYPPQINGGYSFKIGGNPEALLKYGFWNEKLARKWAGEADYILLEMRSYKGWLRNLVNSGEFDELAPTPPQVYCREDAHIRIFRRKP